MSPIKRWEQVFSKQVSRQTGHANKHANRYASAKFSRHSRNTGYFPFMFVTCALTSCFSFAGEEIRILTNGKTYLAANLLDIQSCSYEYPRLVRCPYWKACYNYPRPFYSRMCVHLILGVNLTTDS